MSPSADLQGLAARLRTGRRVAGLLRAAGLALLGYGVGTVLGGAVPLAAAGLLVGTVVLWRNSRLRVTAASVAEHLDRRLPALEESAALLLSEPTTLPAVARLQRERVTARWDRAAAHAALPWAALRRQAGLGLLLGTAGLVAAAWSREGVVGRLADGGIVRLAPAAPSVRRLALRVEPPGYTGLAPHVESGDELLVEEGSRLTWALAVAGEVEAVRLAISTGDTLSLGRDGAAWATTVLAGAPALVRAIVTGPDGSLHLDRDRRLAVRPDRPPVVTLVEPTGRTEFMPGRLPRVAVTVLARDDYGIASTGLAVTLASGRGEQVRFERRTLPFTSRETRPGGGLRLGATLDLGALGLAPGDELYLHAEATDRRTPTAGRGRSETAFLVLVDTTRPPTADFAGLTLAAEPEYFRSQRQIIIDTERLLADEGRLAPSVFRERSNSIGFDQGLLRLRYGQFLGDEFEEDLGGQEAHAEDRPADTPPEDAEAAPDPLAGEVHRHDDAENATLLGASVKTRLKAAVNAMWQAELHLRTHAPRQALLFEYRALELLKSVQQESRAYVQRVGFDPPPIDEARLRLTGKVDGVRNRITERRLAATDSFLPLRRALAAATTGSAGELEGAGDALAPLAVDDPRLLPVLHALRRLGDSLSAGGDCAGCRQEAARRLYPLLPAPDPRRAPAAPGESPLGERYRRLLGERAP